MQNWENFGISFLCKNFIKGSKWYVFSKESNRTMHEENWKVPLIYVICTPKAWCRFQTFFMLYAEKNFFCRLKMCSSAKHGQKLKSNQWLLYTVWPLSISWKQGFNQVWFLWAYFTTEFLIPYSPWTYHKIHDLWCQFWWHTSLISNINCLGY